MATTTHDAVQPLPLRREDIGSTVPARFMQVVDRFADRVAVVGNGERITYRDLYHRAASLAWAIRAGTHANPGCVAYLVDHSPEMIVCALGILLAGKTPLALHPSLPAAAQRETVRDAAPDLILTSSAHALRVHEIREQAACPCLNIDDVGPPRSEAPSILVGPDDAAAIYYTSGSTGQPKGVVKSHRALLHRIWLVGQHDHITPADRQSLLTFPSFAASEADLFGALLYGAEVHLFDVASQGLRAFGEWIETNRLTVLHPPVLLFRRFLATLEGTNLYPSVRLVALAGDVVLPADIETWQRHFSPHCVLTYRFSATETALLSTLRIDQRTPIGPDFLLAGFPVADKQLMLTDEAGEPISANEVGELVVRSEYLAQGYWRRPAETDAAFQSDPQWPAARLYRTGDVGRLLEDGRFVYLGRRDDQVKVRGYRVELREVEAALLQLEQVREAAVVAQRDEEDVRLIAFVVPQPGYAWDESALRSALQQQLPEWKLPSRYQRIDVLPTTLTGKVDRARLSSELHASRASVQLNASGPHTVEDELHEYWRRALQEDDFAHDASFFQLGGNSLSALTVLARIERRFGIRVTPDEFTQADTIDLLAAHIRSHGQQVSHEVATAAPERPPHWSNVVPLQPLGTRPPFFLIHGTGGEVHVLKGLATRLGTDQPVYGIRAAGLIDDRDKPRSVEDMAQRYAREMRSLQSSGPYYLGGYSVGGMIAFETARQLVLAGEVVGLLAVIDTWATNLPWRVFFRTKGAYFLRRMIYHGRRIVRGDVPGRWKYAGERFHAFCRYISANRRHRRVRTDQRRVTAALTGQAHGKDYYLTLAQCYRPEPLDVPVVLFVAEDQKTNIAVAWRYLAPARLEVERVRGTHYTLLRGETTGDLAEAVRRHLLLKSSTHAAT